MYPEHTQALKNNIYINLKVLFYNNSKILYLITPSRYISKQEKVEGHLFFHTIKQLIILYLHKIQCLNAHVCAFIIAFNFYKIFS